MTKREVAEVLKFLHEVYPSFEVTQSKIDAWHSLLSDQDPAIMMQNAERYTLHYKYPPSVSDLRERKAESRSNDFLKEVKKWKGEAVGIQPRS